MNPCRQKESGRTPGKVDEQFIVRHYIEKHEHEHDRDGMLDFVGRLSLLKVLDDYICEGKEHDEFDKLGSTPSMTMASSASATRWALSPRCRRPRVRIFS